MIEEINFLKRLAKANEIIQSIKHLKYSYNKRSLVYQHQKIKLYHYHAKKNVIHGTPLLIVFSTVNRPEILDLFPKQSFIANLLAQGINIYLLDWGYPTNENQQDTFHHYINKYLYHCVNFIIKKNNKHAINLLGICQGGLISLCYTTLFNHINNLILISTPIDFHIKNHLIGNILKHIDYNLLQQFLKKQNMPGELLNQFFLSLQPTQLTGEKYFQFIQKFDQKDKVRHFLQIEKWLHDTPDQPKAAFLELIYHFYLKNKLIHGDLQLNQQKIKLGKITLPVLNIFAKNDKIIPIQASKALQKHINSTDYTEKKFDSGHIGIYINPTINQRMAKVIAKWIKQRS